MLKMYFWCAERDVHSDEPYAVNRSSGTVMSDSPENAYAEVLQEARIHLNNTKAFTILQFNNVT